MVTSGVTGLENTGVGGHVGLRGLHSVREFCDMAFGHLGLNYQDWVKVDPALLRPADVETLRGDCSKARQALGWKNRGSWKDLIVEMVETDLERAREEKDMGVSADLVSGALRS